MNFNAKKNNFPLSKPTNPELDCGASNVSRSIKIISNRLLATKRERNTAPCRMTLICFRFGMRKSNGGLAILRFEPKGLRSRLGSGMGEPPPRGGGASNQRFPLTPVGNGATGRGGCPREVLVGGLQPWARHGVEGGWAAGRTLPTGLLGGQGGPFLTKKHMGIVVRVLSWLPTSCWVGSIPPPTPTGGWGGGGGGTSPLGKALGGWPRGGQDPPPGFEDRLDGLGGAGLAMRVGGSDPTLRKAEVGVHGRLYRFEVRGSKVGGGVPDPRGHVVLRDGGLWPRFPRGGGLALKL